MKALVYIFSIFFFSSSLFSQKFDYSITKIPDSLKQNADAVVRLNQIDIAIKSQREMSVHHQRIITVFNKAGLSSIDAVEYYSKNLSVNEIGATVFNSFGIEIKKIKRKDFREQAILDGITLFSDNRVIYLDYTPTEYPFTVIYESEIETSNTAFIPSWMPITDYYLGIEKSILNVTYPNDLGFKSKEINFENFKTVEKNQSANKLSYSISNVVAQKREDYSPIFSEVFPKVLLGLESFHLEGVDGNAKSWEQFGKWYYEKILSGTIELPEETKIKIKALVGNETDPIKKAKIIYQYVQDKSRYVSIQVGIGGWKPMYAKDVDRLGYGDCKALSNYTKALLDVVNVPSYNTILYGDRSKRSIQSDFVSMQGNHMILCIPDKEKNVFLECTSQTDPFGYQGIFTDDRDVLIIKPEGGEIVHTTIYEDEKNIQKSIGNYAISDIGNLVGAVAIETYGTQYAEKVRIETLLPTEKEAKLKEYWDNIANLKLIKTEFTNNKEKISFTEKIDLSAENYAKPSANNLIFVVNAFNQYQSNLKRIRNRKTPFQIQRGFVDTDEITITLPTEYKIESIPQNYELKSKFGEYKTEIVKQNETNLLYKRTLFIKKGIYSKTEYEDYRLFMDQIARNDNAKIVLLKKQ
jgi:hypothetical protein